MRYLKWVSIPVLLLAGVAGLIYSQSSGVSAASSAALSIAPKKEYKIESGENIKDELTVRNLDTTKPLELSVSVIDFSYNDDSGTPKLMLDKDAPQTAWSLRSYMSVPGKVTVEPGGRKSIPISITIPKEVGAGSYYSAIIYSAGSTDFEGETNVGLSASGVTLVFATVPGKVDEQLTVKNFGSYLDRTSSEKAKYTYWNTREPKVVAYTLENSGNVVESPVGSITLKDLFGHEYVIDDINPSGSLALIGQERTFKACIKQKIDDVDFNGAKSQAHECTNAHIWPGYYKAELAGFYGLNGNQTQEINAKATFWYMPTWFILSVIAGLLVIGYIIWSFVDRARQRQRLKGKK